MVPGTGSTEYVKDRPLPAATDRNAEKPVYPEEVLTPEERASNVLKIGPLGHWWQKKQEDDDPGVEEEQERASDGEEPAQPMEVEQDSVYTCESSNSTRTGWMRP